MFSPKRLSGHLIRMVSTLGVTVVGTVALGLALTRFATDLPTRLAFAVIAVFPVLLALVAVPLFISRFLHELYDIKALKDAHNFLSRLLFSPWAFGPFLVVREGKVTMGAGSTVDKVGGPGSLVIYNDNAVVTERCGKPYRVLGPGFPALERFEKIWEIVDLRPQRWPFKVNAMTREGIPVSCIADVSFKIDDRERDERGHLRPKQPTNSKPYPYTPEAVFTAATSRWVRPPDWTKHSQDWTGRVMIGFTEGTLRNILAEYRLDWLIAPTGSDTEHPREVIRRRLEEQLRQKATNVGAKILRVDLGEIEVDDEQIPHQWLELWQADWESRALATRVEGEAELLGMEVVQSRAQAEMIISLTQHLQSVAVSEEKLQGYLLATRLVQALRLMSFDPFTRTHMPPEALRTLKQIQDSLDSARPSQGEGPV
jgi:hypothetical protein